MSPTADEIIPVSVPAHGGGNPGAERSDRAPKATRQAGGRAGVGACSLPAASHALSQLLAVSFVP